MSKDSAFTTVQKSLDKASTNLQSPPPNNPGPQQHTPKKVNNIIITSTSQGGSLNEKQNLGAQKINNNQGGGLLNQQNRSFGGGKLIVDKPKDQYLTSTSLTAAQYAKRQVEQSLSPYDKFIQGLFMYGKIQRNNLNHHNQADLLKTFQIFTSDQKKRNQILQQLKIPEGRQKLIEMRYLNDLITSIKTQANFYFSLIITQLMQENPYLSFEGSLYLVNRFLQINKSTYYPEQKFNLSIILKECNMKILTDLSSGSIRNEAYFKKMVKDIDYLKDLIIVQYQKFIKMLQRQYEDQSNTQNRFICSDKFLQDLGLAIWKNFKNLINSQRKQITNFFEIKTIFFCLRLILRINPKNFDQKVVMQQILPTITTNIRLIEATDKFNVQIKTKLMNLVDQFLLHLILVHPFNTKNCQKPVSVLLRNEIQRYGYLVVFYNKQIAYENILFPYPMRTAQTILFIEKMIENDQKFQKYPLPKDDFIFESIYNIIAANPSKFWEDQGLYKNITKYLWFIEAGVQQFMQYDYQIDCYYHRKFDSFYRSSWKFAKILGILLFTSLQSSDFAQKFRKIVKNKYIIRDFIRIALQMIIVEDPSNNQTKLDERIETQPIYELFHKIINYNLNFYLDVKKSIAKMYQNQQIEAHIFGNYLLIYSENGENCQKCILAFNKFLEQSSTVQVNSIMEHLSEIDKNIHENPKTKQEITKLEYIVENLMKKSQNYVPLAKNILLILNKFPAYNNHPWMQRLLNEFKQLPEKIPPENMYQYAIILEICLSQIQKHPKSMMTIQQFFNFKFANQFLSNILEVSHQNGVIFNKQIRTNIYKDVSIGVKLLKSMTSLYLRQKLLNDGELVPYEIRKVLQSQNKDGDYQITVRNAALSYHAISYHLALITILISKQVSYDIDVNEFPEFKNDLFYTLINLNAICLHIKSQINLKISVIYNKQLQGEVNKKLNLKLQVLDHIFKFPSYLGFEFLITSGSMQTKQKQLMIQRAKNIRAQKQLSAMRNKSHFLIIYWKEIQNIKIKVDYSKGWLYIKRETTEIIEFLDTFHKMQRLNSQQRQNINQIMENLFILSNMLKNTTIQYYIQFLLKFHNIFFDFRYIDINNIATQHQSASNYQNSLLVFFTVKTFVSSQQFQVFVKQTSIHQHIFGFIRDLLKLTYKKNYNVANDVTNLQIIQFGLTFLVEVVNPEKINPWLKQIKRLIVDRPQKQSPMLTRQIIILILINSKLGQQIPQQIIEFGNKDWLLLMNAAQPSVRHASILIGQLYNIYAMHFIYFTSSCHYLCEFAKTKYLEQLYEVNNYRNVKNTTHTLIEFLKKSIFAEKSYYCIWIIEILIEIFMNKTINKNVRQKFCSEIRVGILSMTIMHERIGELFTKIGCIYSKNYANLWKTSSNINKNQSRILFSQKQQLLAYLRILTFVFFMQKQEKQALPLNQTTKKDCSKVEQDILVSFLSLLPLIACLLKDESEKQAIVIQSQWEKKLKTFDLTKFSQKTIKSSGLKQLNSDKLSEIWKNRTGLNILHEVSNIQLASITTMWISTLRNAPQSQLNKIFFINSEILESYFHQFLKFLQALKKNLVFLKEGEAQIKIVMQFLSEKVYLGSIQVSKQLLYTNMPSLSSSLTLKHDQIKNRLVQSFEFIYSLVKHIYDTSNRQKVKSDQKFSKLFNHFLRSCKEIKHYLQRLGSEIEIPDHESNRSEFTYNTKSYTKSRTIW